MALNLGGGTSPPSADVETANLDHSHKAFSFLRHCLEGGESARGSEGGVPIR